MMLEEKVQEDVERLLAMVCTKATDPKAYEFVSKKLTAMAILGTKPAGSGPRDWSYRSKSHSTDKKVVESGDDYSENKERWIAR
jgi:hypothetical protein